MVETDQVTDQTTEQNTAGIKLFEKYMKEPKIIPAELTLYNSLEFGLTYNQALRVLNHRNFNDFKLAYPKDYKEYKKYRIIGFNESQYGDTSFMIQKEVGILWWKRWETIIERKMIPIFYKKKEAEHYLYSKFEFFTEEKLELIKKKPKVKKMKKRY